MYQMWCHALGEEEGDDSLLLACWHFRSCWLNSSTGLLITKGLKETHRIHLNKTPSISGPDLNTLPEPESSLLVLLLWFRFDAVMICLVQHECMEILSVPDTALGAGGHKRRRPLGWVCPRAIRPPHSSKEKIIGWSGEANETSVPYERSQLLGFFSQICVVLR